MKSRGSRIARSWMRSSRWKSAWRCGTRVASGARSQDGDILQVALKVRRHGRIDDGSDEGPLKVPTSINQVWSGNFVHDQLIDGHSIRLFKLIDDFNRGALGIEVGLSLPSKCVIRTLKQIIGWRRKPTSIRYDNGPEYLSAAIIEWAVAWTSSWNISSRTSHSRTPMSSGLTEPCDTNGYRCTNGATSITFNTSPPTECGSTITNAQIWHWVALPSNSGLPWSHSSPTSEHR